MEPREADDDANSTLHACRYDIGVSTVSVEPRVSRRRWGRRPQFREKAVDDLAVAFAWQLQNVQGASARPTPDGRPDGRCQGARRPSSARDMGMCAWAGADEGLGLSGKRSYGSACVLSRFARQGKANTEWTPGEKSTESGGR